MVTAHDSSSSVMNMKPSAISRRAIVARPEIQTRAEVICQRDDNYCVYLPLSLSHSLWGLLWWFFSVWFCAQAEETCVRPTQPERPRIQQHHAHPQRASRPGAHTTTTTPHSCRAASCTRFFCVCAYMRRVYETVNVFVYAYILYARRALLCVHRFVLHSCGFALVHISA